MKNRLIDFILRNGKQGVEKVETYIDLKTPINAGSSLEYPMIHQVCYFSDDNSLLVYCLDEDNNGMFYVFDEFSEDIRIKISESVLP